MSERSTTRERILEVSRQLFNERGYAATPVAEIAAKVGIAKGNLTYYFPAKLDLVAELAKRVRAELRDARAKNRSGPVADEYVDLVHAAMNHAWENRFLIRDQAQFRNDSTPHAPDPDAAADITTLGGLLKQMNTEAMFRKGLDLDLDALARSLWIVSRYWIDHLHHAEGLHEVRWADQERGLRHHFAVLLPLLTAGARREFESALERLAGTHASRGNHA